MGQSASMQSGVVADLQWCPASPEYLCCASERAGVEVWHVDESMAKGGPRFCWQPRAGEICTALSLTARGQQHFVTLATMPAQPTQGGSVASLWMAGLPEFSQAPEAV